MRVLVCGSRYFNDYELLERTLDDYPITDIIEGEARGADALARLYGERRGIPVLRFPADWNEHGKAAGPIRNKQMLVDGNPDFVVAFRGPNSRGTQNMIDQTNKAKIALRIIEV